MSTAMFQKILFTKGKNNNRKLAAFSPWAVVCSWSAFRVGLSGYDKKMLSLVYIMSCKKLTCLDHQ